MGHVINQEGISVDPSNVSTVVERENDENITCLDTTTLATLDSNVKQFFVMIVFDTFDELILYHDACSLSFSEIYT